MGKRIQLTEEQQRIVEENIKLVYYYADKFVGVCPLEKEEIEAVMMLGLCKAVATYQPGKSQLSTYATRCMRNELFMRLRQEKKWRRQLYLSDIAIRADKTDDDENASYDAFLYDRDAKALEDNAITNVTVERLKEWLHKQEKYMNPTTKKVIDIWIANPEKTQAELAELTNVSQAQVSRILKKIKSQIIDTFFRGNKNWLYGDNDYESELSREFMEWETDSAYEEVASSLQNVEELPPNEWKQLSFDELLEWYE